MTGQDPAAELAALQRLVVDFLSAYYDPRRDAPAFYPRMRAMGEAAGYDFRVLGIRLDTGEETFE